MKLQRKKQEELSVNLTPLIDVVFLLLIFFMVTTSFTRDTQINLELPTAEAGNPLKSKSEMVEISIDGDGRYFVNTQPLVNSQVKTLKRAIRQVSKGNTELPVIVSSDANTPFQAVVSAMDAAGQLGLTNIQLATRNPAE